jgi:hypothetical protein
VLHAGVTFTDHQYVTADAYGIRITVTELTTGHSSTIILNSKVDGPLMPAYSVQQPCNDVSWGWLTDAPNMP